MSSLKNKLIYFLLAILLLFSVLVVVLGSLATEVGSLHYKLTYMFEKELNTKVTIGSVSGDIVNELILKDVIIYHEFRDGMKLVDAEEVRIEFDLARAILKDSVPIRNIKRIGVYNYIVYLDEYFTKTRALKVLVGEDDGINLGASLDVDIRDGEVHSAFLNKSLGSFKASSLDCIFRVRRGSFSFSGAGFLEADEVYGNTSTPFRIDANDSIESGVMRGILDIQSAHYLGYDFKGLALNFLLSSDRIKFNMGPTRYGAYLSGLSSDYISSYSGLHYNYLVDLGFEYILDEDEIYLDINIGRDNLAIKDIIGNFLEDWGISHHFLDVSMWELEGRALFKLVRGNLSELEFFISSGSNILVLGDNISLNIYRDSSVSGESKVSFNNVVYSSGDGTLTGSFGLFNDSKIDFVDVDIEMLHIKTFSEIATRDPDAVLRQVSNDETVGGYKLLSGKLVVDREPSRYVFSFDGASVDELGLPDLEGEVFEYTRNISFNFRAKSYIDLSGNLVLNLDELSVVPFSFDVKSLDYSYLDSLFSIGDDYKSFSNYSFRGKLHGVITPYDFDKSYIRGQVYSYVDVSDKAYFDFTFKKSNIYFNYAYFNDLGISFKGIVGKRGDDYYPELTFFYRGLPLYIDGFVGKGDGDIYHTKFNVVYDNFKSQLSSIDTYLRIRDGVIVLSSGRLRHNRLDSYFSGRISFGDGFLKPNIVLLDSSGDQYLSLEGVLSANTFSNDYIKLSSSLKVVYKEDSYNFNGDVDFSGDEILPSLYVTRTDINGLKQEIVLSGSLYKDANRFNALLEGEYNKSPFDVKSSITPSRYGFNVVFNVFSSSGAVSAVASNSAKLSSKEEGKEGGKEGDSVGSISDSTDEDLGFTSGASVDRGKALFSFVGELGSVPSPDDKKSSLFIKGVLGLSGYNVNIDASLSSKGSAVYSNISFTLPEGHRGELSGYVTFSDRYYFPYFRLLVYPAAYGGEVYLPFIIDGKIVDEEKRFAIDLLINKRLTVRGSLHKYLLMELSLFFNNYPISISDDFAFELYNRYDDLKGTYIRIDEKGFLINGSIAVKELYPLGSGDHFKVDSRFSYFFPFSYSDDINQDIDFSTLFYRNDKVALNTNGKFSYKNDVIKILLSSVKNKFELVMLHSDLEGFLLNLHFDKFDLSRISSDFGGLLTGDILFKGLASNPIILSKSLEIESGRFGDRSFSTRFSIEKGDTYIRVPRGELSIDSDTTIKLLGLSYSYPFMSSSLFDDLGELKKGSSLFLEHLLFKQGVSELILSDFSYNIGSVESVKLFEGDSSNVLLSFLSNPESYFKFRQATFLYTQSNVLSIEDFYFRPGNNWYLDFDSKLRASIYDNDYTSEFSVFGIRSDKDRAELNIIGKKISKNRKYYTDLIFVGEASGDEWDISINRDSVSVDNIIIRKGYFAYSFSYADILSKFSSSGFIDISKEELDVDISFSNADVSKSFLQDIFDNPSGDIQLGVNLEGDINSPNIEGFLNVFGGNFRLRRDEEEEEDELFILEDLNLDIAFNKGKNYHKSAVDYNHYISLETGYSKGIFNIDGYFNLDEWFLEGFDIRLQTFKDMEVELVNNFLNYDGFAGADFNFSGRYSGKKRLDGSVYLREATLSYIGKESEAGAGGVKAESFLDTIDLDTLRVYIMDDVRVNVGLANISLGEVILKEYNKESFLGSRLIVKKTGSSEEGISLSGILTIKKGDFDYLGNTFSIVKGDIIFPKGEGPRIDLKAKTKKIRDENNRTVTVYLTLLDEVKKLFGDSKDTESIFLDSLSSSPSKSRDEITLLLGYGSSVGNDIYADDRYNNSSSGRAADIVLNLALVKPIERKLKEVFGIDSFNIKQSILQNVLSRGDSGSSEYNYLHDSGREIHFFSDTEVTVGKYLSFISDSLFLSGGVILLQDTHPSREGELSTVWKIALEADLLPLFGVDTDRFQVNIGTEYQYRQDEIYESDRHEGIFTLELLVEF